MHWCRLCVEIMPIAAATVGSGLCRRLPSALEIGWSGLFRPNTVSLRCSVAARAAPFLLAGLAVAVLAATPLSSASVLGLGSFLSGMALLAVVDMEWGIVPDLVSLPLIGAGLVAAGVGASVLSFRAAFIGLVVGWLCGKAMQWLAGRFSRSAGVGAVFGGGDVKLLALVGSWLGGAAGYAALVLAVVALWATQRILQGAFHPRRYDAVPLGPYLFVATTGIAAAWPSLEGGIP